MEEQSSVGVLQERGSVPLATFGTLPPRGGYCTLINEQTSSDLGPGYAQLKLLSGQ